MSSVDSVSHERRKLEVAFCHIWGRRSVPYFNLPSDANCEMPARGREGQGRHRLAEGEVVEHDAARHIGEDRAAIFVDGEEEVAAGIQCEAGDVLSVGEGQGV